jgi:hypothetical protein
MATSGHLACSRKKSLPSDRVGFLREVVFIGLKSQVNTALRNNSLGP